MTKELSEIDHEASGETKFLSQYKNSSLLKGFVAAFTKEINDLEEQFILFMTKTSINAATGAQLNGIGRILNAKTRPPDDELFRVLLNALASAYSSEGTVQDIRAVVILTVNASDVFIQEIGGGIFSMTIFKPDFKFGQDVVFDVVSIAKAAGVEFSEFIIADTFSEPTFSFVGDNRPNSEGYAVAVGISSPTTFYSSYSFAPTLSITDRVYLTSSSSNPDQDLTVNFITSNVNTLWNAELLLAYAVVGGTLGWTNKDPLLTKVRLIVSDATDSYLMTVVGDYQRHEFRLRLGGVTKAVIQLDSSTSTPAVLNAIFLPYVAADSASWTTNNPSGLGKTFSAPGLPTADVYATSGGGRYSLLI